MHDPVSSCFMGGVAAVTPPASTEGGPRVTTAVYETQLGLAALTWSRTALCLSLHVDLRLPSPASTSFSSSYAASTGSASSTASVEWTDASFRFRLRPWLFWKRRGSKRFHLKGEHHEVHDHRQQPVVDFAWDLARARFPPGGGPEPAARFFVAVAVDGEMFLVVGDMEAAAYRKIQASRNTIPSRPSTPFCATVISRREHVVLPSSGRPYTTRAMVGGKEREISIDLGGSREEREARLRVEMDGESVLHVKRLKWKFRGNEEVEVEDGHRFQVSWDVHRWFFGRGPDPSFSTAAACTSESGQAVLFFRFDREEPEKEDIDACLGRHSSSPHGGGLLGLYGVGGFSSSSGAGEVGSSMRVGKRGRLLKTTSLSSSSSSASSGSSSSVMEWTSVEEGELQGSDTFSLVVNLWKS